LAKAKEFKKKGAIVEPIGGVEQLIVEKKEVQHSLSFCCNQSTSERSTEVEQLTIK